MGFTMNMKETVQHIAASVKKNADGTYEAAPGMLPILMMGDLGRGKSAAPRVAAQLLQAQFGLKKVPVIDLRLAHCDAGDIKGMPTRGNGYTFYEKPDWFPMHHEDIESQRKRFESIGVKMVEMESSPVGILFIDELNRAPRDVQQAVFQLVYDRNVDGVRLCPGWVICSAINDNSDLYQTTKLDPALLNRFFVQKFNPSDDEYFQFLDAECAAGKAHDCVGRFLKTNPSYIDPSAELIEKATETNTQVYSRRSWHYMAMAILHLEGVREAKVTDWNGAYVRMFASGYVGDEAAMKFTRFVETEYKSLSPKDIVKDYTEEISKGVRKARVDEQASLVDEVLKIIGNFDDKKFTAKIQKNVFHFVVDLPDEVAKKFYEAWTKPPYNGSTLALKFNTRTDWGEGFDGFTKYDDAGKALTIFKKPMERYTSLHHVKAKT